MPAYYVPQPVQYQQQMPPSGQQGHGMYGGYGVRPPASYGGNGGGYHSGPPPSHHQSSSSGGGGSGGDSNMAGFGARRFAEKQAKAAAAAQAQARAADEAAQRAEWERQEYERYHAERAAYEHERQEEERMRWEENKAAEEADRRRAEQERGRLEWEAEEREREHSRRREAEERQQRQEYEEQQRRRQQQQQDEDARRQQETRRYEQDQRERQRQSDERRRAHDAAARAQEMSVAALRAARKEEQAAAAAATFTAPATRPRADSRTAAQRPILKASTSSSSDDAWARNAAAAAAYDQKRAREQASVPTRSATLDSVSTASAHLAYDDEVQVRNSGEQRRIGLGIASAAARETLYEDDFEEGADDNRSTWRPSGNATVRYTQYGGDVDIDADMTIGAITSSSSGRLQVPSSPKAASGARRSMAFVARHDEVPMAKCADCGHTIAFELLASHTCMRSGGALSPASPYLTSSGLPLHAGAESPANERLSPSTARSPFFDKYNRVLEVNGSGRNSPAFVAATPRSGSYDEQTPRTLSRETARSPALSSRTLTSSLVSPALSSPGLPDGTDPMEIARIIAERKRQIEAQREAARNKGGAALAANVVSAALRFKSGGSRSPASHGDDARIPSPREPSPPRRTENKVHAKALSNSSSVSSVQSSLLDPSSPRSRAKARDAALRGVDGGVSPVSTSALTPSSSYDHMSEEEGLATAARHKHVGNVSTPTLSKDPASWRSKKVNTPTLPSSELPASTRPSRRPEIDLGGIEDLLQDLTAESPVASPKPPAQPEHVAEPERVEPSLRSKSKPAALQIDASTNAVTSWQRRQERELREGSAPKRSQQRRTKRCDVCLLNLTDSKTPFVERDGRVLCAADYAVLYLPKCRKCTEPVESDAVKSSDGALKGIFHRDCFSCFCCDQKFEDGVFYCLNNAPYCSKHYHALNGTLCKGCGEGIEGQCRQTEGAERYHPRCFTCTYESDSSFCSEPLEDYFVVGGRRLCEWHAQKMQKALQKGGRDNVKALRRQTILKALA